MRIRSRCFSPDGPHAGRSGAFTLIELLVVMAIISLLISILLPMLDRAKELTRLAVCQANLKSYGSAAAVFSSERDGYAPGALHWTVQWGTLFAGVRTGEDGLLWENADGQTVNYPASYPTERGYGEFDIRNETDYGPHEAWRAFGTSLDTYKKYGVVPGMLSCPSQNEELTVYEWGSHVWLWTDYFYVGGCKSKTRNRHADMPGYVEYAWDYYAWNQYPNVPPATYKMSEGKPSGSVLGMDLVRQVNGGLRYNHESSISSDQPGPQNLVWGDGHVSQRPDGYYEDPLDGSNYSLCSWQGGWGFKYYYWSR